MKTILRLMLLFAFFAFFSIPNIVAQQKIYVDASSTTQPPTGSVEAPYFSLNQAIAEISFGKKN